MRNGTTDTINIVFIKDPSEPGIKYASFAVLILPTVHEFRWLQQSKPSTSDLSDNNHDKI